MADDEAAELAELNERERRAYEAGEDSVPTVPPKRGPRPDAAVLAYVCSNEVSYSWHNSMVQLIAFDAGLHARLGDGRGGFHGMRYGTGGLVEARNQAVYDFLTEFPHAQWLFWLDTDMGFPPETLELLLAAADPVERPIVGALCFSQQEIESDGMGGRRTQPTPVIYDWITVEGQSGYAVRWDYPRDTVTPCHATGSACIAIHRSVLEQIRDKFGPVWYDRIPNPSTAQLFSEDLSFCVRAGALNIPVYVDTRVKTTHLKQVWVSEELYTRERVALALLERRPDISGMKRVAMTREQAWTFDLLPEALAELGIEARSVLHVGAHRGEEVDVYRKCGFEQIALVEPDPDNAGFLRAEFPDCDVIECAVAPELGQATLHRAANTVYSGLMPDAGQPTTGSVEVFTRPLRLIQDHRANVLVVDTQGTELEALATGDLSGVDLVVVETQELSRKLYAAFWPDAVEALGKVGFVPAIRWEHEQHFADTLFVRAPATDG